MVANPALTASGQRSRNPTDCEL